MTEHYPPSRDFEERLTDLELPTSARLQAYAEDDDAETRLFDPLELDVRFRPSTAAHVAEPSASVSLRAPRAPAAPSFDRVDASQVAPRNVPARERATLPPTRPALSSSAAPRATAISTAPPARSAPPPRAHVAPSVPAPAAWSAPTAPAPTAPPPAAPPPVRAATLPPPAAPAPVRAESAPAALPPPTAAWASLPRPHARAHVPEAFDADEQLFPLEVKKAVMALSALVMVAVFVAMYVISSGAGASAESDDAPLVDASGHTR